MAIDWMAWAVTAAFLAPAILLAAKGSSLLVDYAIFLYVINREIRRIVDWWQGSFNPFSPIVLIPLIATCLLVLPFFFRFASLHPTAKKIFILFFLAIGYGTFGSGLQRDCSCLRCVRVPLTNRADGFYRYRAS